ncbi:hypothetical protein Salat_0822000 [Sesamum alatum]|uniref:Uncharacterized protein n=1 Tax=Sesamum alatum TaxID=300844 RepID=A0AAE1YUZ9_9LAMI|nr:hypothetical protein Salat_0822000 [Sesamum alatum]
MEKAKTVGGTSSSFTMDLFGPKESSSSTAFFGSIFGPPTSSMVGGRDTSGPEFGHNYYGNAKNGTDYGTQKFNNPMKKDKNPNSYENGRVEPCYYNSSIYYGGQEVYSPTTQNITPPHNFKKDGGEDPNESNSSCASRGNWWQGSLYY